MLPNTHSILEKFVHVRNGARKIQSLQLHCKRHYRPTAPPVLERGENLRENTFPYKEQTAIHFFSFLLILQPCLVHHNAVKQHKVILSHAIAFVYAQVLLAVNASFNNQDCVGFFSIAIPLWTTVSHICNSTLN